MSRPLKEIKADFDTAADGFVREQLLTEARDAAAEVQRKIKRVLIPVAIVWLLVVVSMALNFVFPVNSESYFLVTMMGISGALGFAVAVTWTVRTFQRERYAAVATTLEDEAERVEQGRASS